MHSINMHVPKFLYFWPQPCSVVLYLKKKKSSIFLTLHIICNHFCKNYYFVIYFYSSKLDWVVLYFLNMALFFLAKNRYSSPLFWSLLSSIEKICWKLKSFIGKIPILSIKYLKRINFSTVII